MAIQNMKLRFTGLSGLIMHSDTLADPLHPASKEMKAISGKKKKTDDDHLAMSQTEWKYGMYHDETEGPYIPGSMVKAVLIAGATKFKAGPKMKGGVLVNGSKCKLEYDGPRDTKGMWDDGRFAYRKTVVVSRARVMRTRPIFPQWSFVADLAYDTEVMDKAEIVRAAQLAGQLCGIGDYRVEKGGEFGRFEVQEVKK